MKAKREHRKPLSDAAVQILTTIRPDTPKPTSLVFPGAKEEKPLSDVALTKLLPARITCHGFRSSFRNMGRRETILPHPCMAGGSMTCTKSLWLLPKMVSLPTVAGIA